jgi:hypothetical protein
VEYKEFIGEWNFCLDNPDYVFSSINSYSILKFFAELLKVIKNVEKTAIFEMDLQLIKRLKIILECNYPEIYILKKVDKTRIRSLEVEVNSILLNNKYTENFFKTILDVLDLFRLDRCRSEFFSLSYQ